MDKIKLVAISNGFSTKFIGKLIYKFKQAEASRIEHISKKEVYTSELYSRFHEKFKCILKQYNVRVIARDNTKVINLV